MKAILKLDDTFARLENAIVFVFGLLSANIYLLIARIIFGLPLIMNGVSQLGAMSGLLDAQMQISGIDPVWKVPAALASLLAGLAILLGYRIRLAALLYIFYVVAATLMVHNSHTLLANGIDVFEIEGSTIGTFNMASGRLVEGPTLLPEYARKNCEWYIKDFRQMKGKIVNDDFVLGCSLLRVELDQTISMRHFTIFVPALLFLIAAGAGRFSIEGWLSSKRNKA